MSSVAHQEEGGLLGRRRHPLARSRVTVRDERGASGASFARVARRTRAPPIHTSYGVTTAVKTSAESVMRSHLGESVKAWWER